MYHNAQVIQPNQNPNQQQGQIKIIGNYQYNIKYCLGEGAYGKVYEGTDSKTQRKVAIKKIDIKSFERDNYLRNQIISEIEILKRFNHRNIVQFLDMITTQRSLYIITEYCADGDLRQLMQRKRLSEDQSIQILKHMVEGFKELIKHNVIHRDLKPANILVHEGIFKIADFGFAKFVDYSSSQLLRSCVGSPLYMAPQILKRQQYGTKCDIWSLGIIFHEMVFHDVPWKARTEQELLNNIMTKPFRIRPGAKISKFTEEVLKRTLVIDESRRISWDQLFEMCNSHQSQQNNSRDNKENQINGGLFKQNSLPNGQEQKTRKSIFDNEPKANTQVQQLSKTQLQKIETTKIFNSLNQVRSEVVFRHYVCVHLLNEMESNRRFIKREMIYERFLLVLSCAVKARSFNIMKQIRDLEHKKEDYISQSKELQLLSKRIKKEHDYYTNFIEDIIDQFKMQGIMDSLRNESELQFVFLDVYSDAEIQKIEQLIDTYGKDLCKEIVQDLKQRKLEEALRKGIVTVDYIIDVILSKKKELKGQEANYEQLHIEKSEQHDLKHYFEKSISRIQLFQSAFSFF